MPDEVEGQPERHFTAMPSCEQAKVHPAETCIFKSLQTEEANYNFADAIRFNKEQENERRIQEQLAQIERIRQANALRLTQGKQQQNPIGFGFAAFNSNKPSINNS